MSDLKRAGDWIEDVWHRLIHPSRANTSGSDRARLKSRLPKRESALIAGDYREPDSSGCASSPSRIQACTLAPEIWVHICSILEADPDTSRQPQSRSTEPWSIGAEGRNALQALSLTCRTLSAIAQQLLFVLLDFRVASDYDPSRTHGSHHHHHRRYADRAIKRLEFYSSPRIAPHVRFFRYIYSGAWDGSPKYVLAAAMNRLSVFGGLLGMELHGVGQVTEVLESLVRPIPTIRLIQCSLVAFKKPSLLSASWVCLDVSDDDEEKQPSGFDSMLGAMLQSGQMRGLEVGGLEISELDEILLHNPSSILLLRRLTINIDPSPWFSFGALELLTLLEELAVDRCAAVFDHTRSALPRGSLPKLRRLQCTPESICFFSNITTVLELILRGQGRHSPPVIRPECNDVHRHILENPDFFSRIRSMTLSIGHQDQKIDRQAFKAMRQVCSSLTHLVVYPSSPSVDCAMTLVDQLLSEPIPRLRVLEFPDTMQEGIYYHKRWVSPAELLGFRLFSLLRHRRSQLASKPSTRPPVKLRCIREFGYSSVTHYDVWLRQRNIYDRVGHRWRCPCEVCNELVFQHDYDSHKAYVFLLD